MLELACGLVVAPDDVGFQLAFSTLLSFFRVRSLRSYSPVDDVAALPAEAPRQSFPILQPMETHESHRWHLLGTKKRLVLVLPCFVPARSSSLRMSSHLHSRISRRSAESMLEDEQLRGCSSSTSSRVRFILFCHPFFFLTKAPPLLFYLESYFSSTRKTYERAVAKSRRICKVNLPL
jgi:hypothetical protein